MRLLDFALLFALLDPGASARVDADVHAVLSNLHVPGATVEVVRNGAVEYRRGYGYRDLNEKLPALADTHYEIGSITKQFTAAAILRLRDQGLVNLDAPVATYIPTAPHSHEVTVRQCLTHTSGLPEYLDGPDELFTGSATFDQLMARVKDKPLNFAPGSDWSYSNTGYAILGRIIEVVTHQTYEHYIHAQFLQPLGMRQTFTIADEINIPGMAVGYHRADGAIKRAPVLSESYGFSAGDLVSTVDDLETWSTALSSGKVVPQSDYALMTSEQKTTKNEGTGYGFGLFLDSIDGQPRVGHTGGSLGFTTADEYFPKQNVRIIAFTNVADGNPEAGETLTTAIFEDLYPAIAAEAKRPTTGEDPAITAKTDAFFRAMQAGTVPESVLTPRLHAKFESHLSKQLAQEYAPFGTPTAFVFKEHHTDSGLDWYTYEIRFGPGVIFRFGLGLNADGKVASISFG